MSVAACELIMFRFFLQNSFQPNNNNNMILIQHFIYVIPHFLCPFSLQNDVIYSVVFVCNIRADFSLFFFFLCIRRQCVYTFSFNLLSKMNLSCMRSANKINIKSLLLEFYSLKSARKQRRVCMHFNRIEI